MKSSKFLLQGDANLCHKAHQASSLLLAYHSSFSDLCSRFSSSKIKIIHLQGKELVCIQDLPHKRLGESKNIHLEQSKPSSAFNIIILDVIALF